MKKRIIGYSFVLISNIRKVKIAIRFSTNTHTNTHVLLYYIQEESEAKLFEWSDGILVHAMLEGSCLLIDEISLADDAVLERLNSVLEPERTLLVAEKGCSSTSQPYLIRAQEGFVLMATMNPGGDYGKKEVKCIH